MSAARTKKCDAITASSATTNGDVISESTPPSSPPFYVIPDDVTMSLEAAIENEMRLRGLKEKENQEAQIRSPVADSLSSPDVDLWCARNKDFDALVESPSDQISVKFENLLCASSEDLDGGRVSLTDLLSQDESSEAEYETMKTQMKVLQSTVVMDSKDDDDVTSRDQTNDIDLLTDTRNLNKPDATQIRLDLTPDVVRNFRTKKFFETDTDDAVLSEIFSRTISSAGATPTDDDILQKDMTPPMPSPRIVIDSPEEDIKSLVNRGRPAFLLEDFEDKPATATLSLDQNIIRPEPDDAETETSTNWVTVEDAVKENVENSTNTAAVLNENEFLAERLTTESHEGSLTESQIQDDILDKSLEYSDEYVLKTDEEKDMSSSQEACSRSFDENLEGFDEDTGIIDEILHSSSSFGMRDINRLEDLVQDMSNAIDENLKAQISPDSSATCELSSGSGDANYSTNNTARNANCALERLVQCESSSTTVTTTSSSSSSSAVTTRNEETKDQVTKLAKVTKTNGEVNGAVEGTPKKKTKKAKKEKVEAEKENISVTKSEIPPRRIEIPPRPVPSDLPRYEDDLSNINVKHLKQNYCIESSRQNLNHPEQKPPPPLINTGVSIKQLKSSFNKFDALQKKSLANSKSSGDLKSPDGINEQDNEKKCRSCSRVVFQMEQIKAENRVYHKNCFRCKDCNKQLTVDTYESHESELYCKPHFKALFAPKVIEDSQPTSDKPDLTLELEELNSLNVRSRFQVFEQGANSQDNELERTPSVVNVKRSPSILSKLAKFQRKGMDVGITDDVLNGSIPHEMSSEEEKSDSEEDGEFDGEEDPVLARAKRRSARSELAVSFAKTSDIKQRFEPGHQTMSKEERREERKQEIQNIRSRLFMGKQAKIKEMYQQAVAESEQGITSSKKPPVVETCEKAKSIMEKFEKGEAFVSARDADQDAKGIEQEDMSVFDAGICKKSRSMFLELDASAAKSAHSPHNSHAPRTPELKKSNTQTESPEREVYRDPSIVTAGNEENGDDPEIAERSHTATKMLNIFRQMEERKETQPQGPKPLKRFTPPPEETPRRFLDTNDASDNSGVTDSESEDDTQNENQKQNGHHQNGVGRDGVDYVKSSDKCEDEFLKQARNEARAKQLRAKFEKWESSEIKREQSTINVLEECQIDNSESQLESAKSLRDRFESMREMTNQMNKSPRVKVNRFVEIQSNCAEYCAICEKKVYPLEKIDCNSKIYHKQCFRCVHCNTILRMDTYTHNHGVLYCIPHFKQLFISKGNYESGFGLDPHKTKWENNANNAKQEVTATE